MKRIGYVHVVFLFSLSSLFSRQIVYCSSVRRTYCFPSSPPSSTFSTPLSGDIMYHILYTIYRIYTVNRTSFYCRVTSFNASDGSVLLSSPPLQHRAHRSRFALNPRYAMPCTHSLLCNSIPPYLPHYLLPLLSTSSLVLFCSLPPSLSSHLPINPLPLFFPLTKSASFPYFPLLHSIHLSYFSPSPIHSSLFPALFFTDFYLPLFLVHFSFAATRQSVEQLKDVADRVADAMKVLMSVCLGTVLCCTVMYYTLLYCHFLNVNYILLLHTSCRVRSYHITLHCTAPFILSSIHSPYPCHSILLFYPSMHLTDYCYSTLIGETSLKSSAVRLESMLSGVSHDMLGDAVSDSQAPHILVLHNFI